MGIPLGTSCHVLTNVQSSGGFRKCYLLLLQVDGPVTKSNDTFLFLFAKARTPISGFSFFWLPF